MIEIIPNWHPIFVHFSVALLLVATVILGWSLAIKRAKASDTGVVTGRTMLWLGLVALVATVLAGLQAYYSVGHDAPSHAAMTNHRNWGLASLAAFLLAGAFCWSGRSTSFKARDLLLLLASSTLLIVTAYKGGELVYRYGLGVQSLPEVTGDGHDHDHGDEHSHSNETLADSAPDEGCDEGEADTGHAHPNAEYRDPALVADELYEALRTGNEARVLALLAEDVVILEGGHAQTSRSDYMSGHMKSDMAFLPNVTSETLDREVSRQGDLAWVITHSRTTGTYRDEDIDQSSREMLVMKHDGHDWRITLIHWGDK